MGTLVVVSYLRVHQAVAQQQKSALQLQSEQLNALRYVLGVMNGDGSVIDYNIRHGRIAAEAAARAVAQAEAMQMKGFSSGTIRNGLLTRRS